MVEEDFRGETHEKAVMINLDLTDRKILYILCANARISNTTIAKVLKLSREVVSYRIKAMEKANFLVGYLTLVNPRKLGFEEIIIYFKLKSLKQENEIINFLKEIEGVAGIKTCSGKYDLQIILSAKTFEEIYDIKRKILETYGHVVEGFNTLVIMDMDFLDMKYLLDDESLKQLEQIKETKGSAFMKEFHSENSEEHVIDLIDRKILKLLQTNARISLIEVARKLNLSPLTIKNRINSLIHTKVIKCFLPYFPRVDLGYQWYEISLKFKNLNERKFMEYIRQHKNIVWVVKFIGEWDYQISIFAKSHSHFQEILNEFKEEFSEALDSYENLFVFNQFMFVRRIE